MSAPDSTLHFNPSATQHETCAAHAGDGGARDNLLALPFAAATALPSENTASVLFRLARARRREFLVGNGGDV